MKPARAARLLHQLPVNGRVYKQLQPANNWDWNEVLLNKLTFLVEILTWQNTKDAQKGRIDTAPKMYTPDFMKKAIENKALDADQAVHTVDEIKAILAKPRT